MGGVVVRGSAAAAGRDSNEPVSTRVRRERVGDADVPRARPLRGASDGADVRDRCSMVPRRNEGGADDPIAGMCRSPRSSGG